VYLDLPSGAVERHFGNACDLAARIVDIGKTERAALAFAAPVCHLGDALDRFVGARRALE